jgi:L-arabinose isomerase
MNEETIGELQKVPEKIVHGLSEEEHKWLQKWFEGITDQQEKQTKILKTMNTAVQIIGLIILLSAILAACSALGLRL